MFKGPLLCRLSIYRRVSNHTHNILDSLVWHVYIEYSEHNYSASIDMCISRNSHSLGKKEKKIIIFFQLGIMQKQFFLNYLNKFNPDSTFFLNKMLPTSIQCRPHIPVIYSHSNLRPS